MPRVLAVENDASVVALSAAALALVGHRLAFGHGEDAERAQEQQ
jgi:hypothetical protein